MISLLAIPLIMLSDISLRVAPERAVPIIYPDEPIIVQISELNKGTHEISGTLTTEQGHEIPLDLSAITLRNTSPYYLTLPEIPSSFGPHTLSLTIGDSSTKTTLYRHLRPNHDSPNAVRMTFPKWNDDAHFIALEVALKEARIYLGNENDQEVITTLSGLDTRIRVVIDAKTTQPQLEKWINDYAQDISTWEFELSANPKNTLDLIQLLLQMQPNTQISLRPQTALAFQLFLTLQSKTKIHDIVLTEADPDQDLYRPLAQQAGIEFPYISIVPTQDTPQTLSTPIPPFTPLMLTAQSIDHSTPSGMSTLSLLNHWTEILPLYESIGPYSINKDITAQLYRSTNSDMPWLMVLSTTSVNEMPIPESLSGTQVLTRHLAPLTKNQSETLRLEIQPIFLTGTDSAPIAQALCTTLNQHALTIMANKEYTALLPKRIQAYMNTFITATPETTFRSQFLSIVQQFPVLEEKYNTGEIPQTIAIPLTAQLAHIARLVSALEQYTGEPFLESPSTTLAQCNNFLADYLSRGIPQEEHSREITLLTEINRLMTEAKDLDKRGLTTEATAVATIAEWRARALLKRAEKTQ